MYTPGLSILSILTTVLLFKDSSGLTCHQCNGWNGHYKPGKTQVSTCDNRNNQCASPKYCVKIVDPIDPEFHYITYKADCWFENTILTNNTITQTIANKACYSWTDGGTPAKTYLYCFCNDADYCNSSTKIVFSIFAIILSFLFKVVF